MGADSGIEWTTHTFNPWRGCTKISPGCAHCYAETMSHRNPKALGEWGDDALRVIGNERYWNQPNHWNAWARTAGRRDRVFCMSLGDWLEDRPDLDAPRKQLVSVIEQCPNLDWLMLTKRPENFLRVMLRACGGRSPTEWLEQHPNVWFGVSVEDQPRLLERLPLLLAVPAAVRFISFEPLIGPINLPEAVTLTYGRSVDGEIWYPVGAGFQWGIVGGETGPVYRVMQLEWMRSLVEQLKATGAAVFVKQDCGHRPGAQRRIPDDLWALKEFPTPLPK